MIIFRNFSSHIFPCTKIHLKFGGAQKKREKNWFCHPYSKCDSMAAPGNKTRVRSIFLALYYWTYPKTVPRYLTQKRNVSEVLGIPFESMDAEYKWVASLVHNTTSPIVFCHNDLHGKNMMANYDNHDKPIPGTVKFLKIFKPSPAFQ